MLVVFHDDHARETAAVVDTILIEPDAQRLALTWRASSPLGRNIREVAKVIVGQRLERFEQARAHERRMQGKQHFKSLDLLIRWATAASPPETQAS
ncbi:hypothetical protein AO265_16730 [Pseudomonas sp. ABAC61]|nr:hypothetical protein AO265_16730 [Pseudomonas sp. ABAC61]